MSSLLTAALIAGLFCYELPHPTLIVVRTLLPPILTLLLGRYLASRAARALLELLGWQLLTPTILREVQERERLVIVFAHTSYWDFYLLLLYLAAYPQELARVRTLVKPQPFRYCGRLLRWLGAVESTRIEDKGGNAVERICTELESRPSVFLISPKGSIVKREWRTGYYHIARRLDCPIRVSGLDYEQKQIKLFPEVSSKLEEPEVRRQLLEHLADIVPLHPEREVVAVRAHGPTSVSDNWRVIIWIVAALVALLFWS